MKTLELAQVLEDLATLLRRLPDAQLGQAGTQLSLNGSSRRPATLGTLNGISLARMSKYTKAELASLIEENQIPLLVRKKDSAADLLRRLRRYLRDNSESKRHIRNQVAHGRTSPELTSALSYLLKDRYE